MKCTLQIIHLSFFILNFPMIALATSTNFHVSNYREEFAYNSHDESMRIYDYSDGPTVEKPDRAQCVAEYESKTYLTPIEQGKEVQFTCRYKCNDNNNLIHKVIVRHKLMLTSGYVESVEMVCDGVVMESKNVGEQSVYMPVKVAVFYAAESSRAEIIEWKKKYNVKIPQNIYLVKVKEFNIKIKQVADALLHSGQTSKNSEYLMAGRVLSEIISESSQGKRYLSDSLVRIKQQIVSDKMWQKIVDMYVKFNGKFLLD